MTARLKNLSPTAQVALVVGVLLLVVLVGWFALISPKRSTASSLEKQTAAVQAEIARNSSSAFTQALPAVRSASVFSLTQAMPTKLDTPGVIITLNGLAHASGISTKPNSSLDQMTSSAPRRERWVAQVAAAPRKSST